MPQQSTMSPPSHSAVTCTTFTNTCPVQYHISRNSSSTPLPPHHQHRYQRFRCPKCSVKPAYASVGAAIAVNITA